MKGTAVKKQDRDYKKGGFLPWNSGARKVFGDHYVSVVMKFLPDLDPTKG